ncbi:MAG: maltose ABC transporter substrate-binding protein [Eubacteriales bacterium]|nr:maltose ABC transporter substrate-binding protein [Eubacteriales bacterium]MDD3882051.1 maltose ABC transporter substrate-binding protein [Eubacteriales bacterium]MDD4512498.1 maltose ABC transporter substrate-binding protein [Eubacteriales bacterium]
MKKVLSVLLVLAMLMVPALSLAEEPVTLLVWESDGVELDFMKAAAEKYTALNPNITFEFNSVSHTDAVQKMELDGPAEVGADVFAAPHDKMGQVVAGELALPNDAAETVKNNFMPAAYNACTYGGVTYGYPMAIETYALFYNKDLIDEAPATWQEVEEFCADYNDPSQNRYGLVWEVGAPYYNYIFISAYGADLFGPAGDDQSKHEINSEASIKGMTYFQTLKDKILPVAADDLTGAFCSSAFMDEKTAAMYITGPWSIKDSVDKGVNLGIAKIPTLPDAEQTPASFSGVRLMLVSAFSKHPAEAKAFAEFLMTPEIQKLRSDMTSTISPCTSVTSDNEYFNGIMAQAAFAKPMPSIPAMDGYWTAMTAAFKQIWDGAPIVEQLNAAAQVIESIGK